VSSPVGKSILETEVGVVVRVERERPGAQELRVRVKGGEEHPLPNRGWEHLSPAKLQ